MKKSKRPFCNNSNANENHNTHLISLTTLSNHSYPDDIHKLGYDYQWSNDQSCFKIESKYFQLLKPSSLTWRADLPIEKSRRFINLKSFQKPDQIACCNNASHTAFMRNITIVTFDVTFNKEEELSQSFINEVKKNDSNEITDTAIKELKTNLANAFEEEKLFNSNQCLPNDDNVALNKNKSIEKRKSIKKRKAIEKRKLIEKSKQETIIEKRNMTKSPDKPKITLLPFSNKKLRNTKTTINLKPKSQEKKKKFPISKEKGKEKKEEKETDKNKDKEKIKKSTTGKSVERKKIPDKKVNDIKEKEQKKTNIDNNFKRMKIKKMVLNIL